MNKTSILQLQTYNENDNPLFLDYRKSLNDDTNSNMTKIEAYASATNTRLSTLESQSASGNVGDGTITNTKLATDVKVGSLATLTTTNKSSVVSAINEIVSSGVSSTVGDGTVTNAKLATDVKVGSLATLTTTNKSSVVSAINEIVSSGVSGTVGDGTVTNAKLATDVKVGSLSALVTTNKSSVVSAINEIASTSNGGSAVVGKTYYVAKTGNNNNNGTSISTPFLTISKASSVATAGDTVIIRAGTYNERVTCTNSGTANNWITYKNYSDNSDGGVIEDVFIDGTGLVSGEPLFDFYGQSYIRLIGVTVQNWINPSGYGGAGIGDTSATYNGNIVVQYCNTYNTDASGVLFYNAHHIIVDNVWVDYSNLDNNQEAISFEKIDNFEISNCRITRPWKEGIDCKSGCSNGKIHHNHVRDVVPDYFPAPSAIYIDAWDSYVANIEIYENRVDNSYVGIAIGSEMGGDVKNIYVHHNYIDDCWYPFNVAGSISGELFDKITVSHNTITNYGRDRGYGAGWAGITVRNPVANLLIYANTLYTPYSNAGAYAGLIPPFDLSEFYSKGGNMRVITIDKNVVDRFNPDFYFTYPIGSNASFKNAKATTANIKLMNLQVGDMAFSTNANKPVWCTAVGLNHVASLNVTAGATTSGNITITLNGADTTVAMTAGWTATQVATAIRNAFFGYWSTGGTGTTITFTRNVRGLSTATIFTAGTTGVTAVMSTVTSGTSNAIVDGAGTAM